MKIAVLFAGLLALAACGAGGEPVPPKVTATQSVGVNSASGTFSRTTIGFQFGG